MNFVTYWVLVTVETTYVGNVKTSYIGNIRHNCEHNPQQNYRVEVIKAEHIIVALQGVRVKKGHHGHTYDHFKRVAHDAN